MLARPLICHACSAQDVVTSRVHVHVVLLHVCGRALRGIRLWMHVLLNCVSAHIILLHVVNLVRGFVAHVAFERPGTRALVVASVGSRLRVALVLNWVDGKLLKWVNGMAGVGLQMTRCALRWVGGSFGIPFVCRACEAAARARGRAHNPIRPPAGRHSDDLEGARGAHLPAFFYLLCRIIKCPLNPAYPVEPVPCFDNP